MRKKMQLLKPFPSTLSLHDTARLQKALNPSRPGNDGPREHHSVSNCPPTDSGKSAGTLYGSRQAPIGQNPQSERIWR